MRNPGKSGARRISKELERKGETCGRRRAVKLHKKRRFRAIQPKSHQPKTTDSRHGLGYNENLLMVAASPIKIDQVWVGDISYIPTQPAFGSRHCGLHDQCGSWMSSLGLLVAWAFCYSCLGDVATPKADLLAMNSEGGRRSTLSADYSVDARLDDESKKISRYQ